MLNSGFDNITYVGFGLRIDNTIRGRLHDAPSNPPQVAETLTVGMKEPFFFVRPYLAFSQNGFHRVQESGVGLLRRDFDLAKVNRGVFDSSVERKRPASFPLTRVISCWTEALQLMHVGEKAEVTCPPKTAYGLRGSPPKIPANATLTFEIELLSIR